jgi:MATE family multidrug resistance protein
MAGLTLGVVVFAVTRDVTPLLVLLKIDPRITPYTKDALAALTCGAPATCVLTAFVQYRQGRGDSRTPMIVGISGNVINAMLGWSLIYGHFGLPALGVRGAGYATATTEYLEVIALGAVTLREGVRGAQTPSIVRAFVEVCELGLPTGFQFICEMLAFTAFTAILGEIGGEQVAAHQIALQVLRMSFLPGIAIAEAASVLVGQSLGRRSLSEADKVTRAALRAAVAFMAACGILFAIFASVIAGAFTDDPHVALIAKRLLLVSALFQVLDAISIVFRGALRGAKDVRIVAIAGIVISWTCVPGAAYLLGRELGLGALGGWLGFIAETLASTLVFSARWKRGAWRAPYALAEETAARESLDRDLSEKSASADIKNKSDTPQTPPEVSRPKERDKKTAA